ncbi:GTP pyrophosphokinase [Nocardia rhamnosiphila]
MTERSQHVDWGAAYDSHRQQYQNLRREVQFALRHALTESGVTVHDVVARVKTRNSFIEKIQRKGYKDPFDEMCDIVGARVVCLFLDDLPVVDSVISNCFEVKAKEDKLASAPPDAFRYRSVHYECSIRSDYIGPHYANIKDLVFEIQVRTILQDAWAVVEHTLAYKGSSIPNNLRRDFGALMGLFHIADKAFQQLRDDSKASEIEAQEVIEPVASKVNNEDPDMDISKELVELKLDRGTTKAMLYSLCPNREKARDLDYSDIVGELARENITDTRQLLHLYLEFSDLAEFSEANNPPVRENPDGTFEETLFTDVGLFREMLRQKNPNFQTTSQIKSESNPLN